MAFKKVNDYNNEKFGGLFLLRNDGDYADVVFMYRSEDDALVADTHYVKSSDYSGYVHCCGRGCPACEKGIRVQTKLFIPIFNISSNELQFWDRTMRFENQLKHDVFANYPNPSEYVFRITRKGAPNDVNTTYSIMVIGRNTFKSYDDIISEYNVSYPDHYETICKEMSESELRAMLSNGSTQSQPSAMPEYSYNATPRVAFSGANDSMSPPAYSESIPDVASMGDAEEIEEPIDF